ncbi:hypothetical protein ACP70R_020872 [Stipagrostis hirtigluma subsp. patula]
MAAEEASHPSRYVKLGKEQDDAPAEDVRPGELNLPVRVPQLEVKRCNGCGQVLPEGYQAPADEEWTTGIFGCADDTESCWTGLLCPCVLFGRNAEALTGVPWTRPCTCHAVCVEGGIALAVLTAAFHGVAPEVSYLIGEGLVCGWMLSATYLGLFRQDLQKKYHLKNSPCDFCLVHCCLHWCAICQEHRERKARLADHSIVPVTIVNPPPVQEMSMAENRPSAIVPEKEATKNEHDNVEDIPIPL